MFKDVYAKGVVLPGEVEVMLSDGVDLWNTPFVAAYEALPKTMVLALGHTARAGKDSAAQVLIETAPRDTVRFAFADALYAYCRVVRGMTAKDATLLQHVGVEFRESDPETWIRVVYWAIRDRQPKVAVITDCRFPNELAFVRAMGGVTLKMERLNADGSRFVAPDRDPQHVSEVALAEAEWDETVRVTSGDMLTLRDEVLRAFKRLERRWKLGVKAGAEGTGAA